jgi:hypothetical protein
VPGGAGVVDVEGGTDVDDEAGGDAVVESDCADVAVAESSNIRNAIAKDLILFQPPCQCQDPYR